VHPDYWLKVIFILILGGFIIFITQHLLGRAYNLDDDDDKKDNKRILFYSTKNRAENCNDGSFYNNSRYPNYKYHVEPVKIKIIIEEVKE
jgi:hypothetical protein